MPPAPVNSEGNASPEPPRPALVRADRAWGLPLLTKELIEMAARPRTYQVRAVYAGILMLICFLVLSMAVPSYAVSPLAFFGVGSSVLNALCFWQAFGLYLTLPVLACGTLTVEKERKTLDLLLLTKLGPGTIILEKFLSRLIPALNFLLISAPLLAFSYSLGGITVEMVAFVLLSLTLTAIRLTAVGVMCSAGFRTTSRALVGTYGVMFLCGVVLDILFMLVTWNLFRAFMPGLQADEWLPIFPDRESRNAMIRFQDPLFVGLSSITSSVVPLGQFVTIGCVSSLLLSSTILVLARWLLCNLSYGRSSESSSRKSLSWRQREHGVTSPPVRWKVDVPEYNPISWREGIHVHDRERWWIKQIVRACLSVLILLVFFSMFGRISQIPGHLTAVTFIVWFVLTLWICIKTSGLIVEERTRQTLDVLLTTPMTGEDIIKQKMVSVNWIIILGRFALGTCVLIHMLIKPNSWYLVCSVLMICLYPPIIAWQAMVCGLTAKNGAWALLKSLLMIAIRCLAPYLILLILAIMLSPVMRDGEGIAFLLACCSPVSLMIVSEVMIPVTGFQDLGIGLILLAPFVTGIVNGILLSYLKYKATFYADDYLGRVSVKDGPNLSYAPVPYVINPWRDKP